MKPFETQKTAATEVKTAIADKEKINSAEKKKVDDAIAARKKAISEEEEKPATDTTKMTPEALAAAKTEFETFKTEITTLLAKKKIEDEKVADKTENERGAVAEAVTEKIGEYTIEDLKTLKDKSRKELWTDPKYIITMQNIIIQTGAKHESVNDAVLTNGIYGSGTKAGILTLQKYLNTTYTAGITADGLAGGKTLTALLEMDGDKTRLEKIIADHSDITPELPVTRTTTVDTKESKVGKKAIETTLRNPAKAVAQEPNINGAAPKVQVTPPATVEKENFFDNIKKEYVGSVEKEIDKKIGEIEKTNINKNISKKIKEGYPKHLNELFKVMTPDQKICYEKNIGMGAEIKCITSEKQIFISINTKTFVLEKSKCINKKNKINYTVINNKILDYMNKVIKDGTELFKNRNKRSIFTPQQ